MRHIRRLFVLLCCVLHTAPARAADEGTPAFACAEGVFVLDSALTPGTDPFPYERTLLPRVADDTLRVVTAVPRPVDSLHSVFFLYTVPSGTLQRLVVPDSTIVHTRLVEYAIDGDRVVLVHVYGILVLTRRGEEWRFDRAFALDYPVMYARVQGATVYLWNELLPVRGGRGVPYTYSFDLARGTASGLRWLPQPSGAVLMNVMQRTILTRTAQTIAQADVDRYVIRLYDAADTTRCDTIGRTPADWRQAPDTLRLPYGRDSLWVYNIPVLDSVARRASLITRLVLEDDSTLIVVRRTPAEAGAVRYSGDRWRRSGRRWMPVAVDQPLHGAGEEEPYTLQQVPMSPRAVYSGGLFVELVPYPLDYRTDYLWSTRSACASEARRYFHAYTTQYTLVARRPVWQN